MLRELRCWDGVKICGSLGEGFSDAGVKKRKKSGQMLG